MEEEDITVSGELVALTYGAFVAQIVKDYESIEEINKQIELLGYNIGLRLIEEFLARTRTRGTRSFRTCCTNIATKAFPMYIGIPASIENWSEDEKSSFKSNPLSLFVELPDEMESLQYNNIYCGVIRGSFEMIHMKVDCSFIKDTLKGDDTNEIKIQFVEYLDDSIQYMLSDE